jgi:hypothetical protein
MANSPGRQPGMSILFPVTNRAHRGIILGEASRNPLEIGKVSPEA